ncbi:TlpA disulfide reductase family protein [Catenovulum sediminis]|uniref:TlpA disulfide reductase family protein n=2 Tax=Catenovulum sediminis TaxID=1740262 RepID=A0ABV1RGU0_9ALTE
MRPLIKLICTLLLLTVSQFTAATPSLPAPDFELNVVDLPKKLSDLKGQVVYLDFWASWCAPCRKSFPWMNDMQNKYQDKGFTVIAVTVDADKTLAEQFLQEVPANFPIVYDTESQIAQSYQLKGMPSSYLIDKNGQLRYVHVGFLTAKKKQYEDEIKGLLKE